MDQATKESLLLVVTAGLAITTLLSVSSNWQLKDRVQELELSTPNCQSYGKVGHDVIVYDTKTNILAIRCTDSADTGKVSKPIYPKPKPRTKGKDKRII